MNILPDTEKSLIVKGLRRRFYVVALILVSIAFILGTVMLLPSYFLTRVQVATVISDASNENEIEKKYTEILNLPTEIEYKLNIFQKNYADGTVIFHLLKLEEDLPEKIKINTFSFRRNALYNEKRGTVITVSGVAADRDSLVQFSTSLKSSKSFSVVDVPISSLTKDKNLPFSMNLFIAN